MQDRQGFIETLKQYKYASMRQAPGIVQLALKAFYGSSMIWEYQGSTGQVVLGTKEDLNEDVLKALDISGVTELTTSLSGSEEQKRVRAGTWRDWFVENAKQKFLIPDTNFVLRHYGSNVLARLLASDFRSLNFRLPRLVVLEIERQANQKVNDALREKDPGKAREKDIQKRLAFYAAKEIKFLRNNTLFDLLPNVDASLISSFTTKAGQGLTDIWIRKEIHDSNHPMVGYSSLSPKDVLFLTCDLMNALAAEAEGLTSCYFARQEQETYFIDLDYPEYLFDLIMVSAVIFESIRVDVILVGDEVHNSCTVQGVWKGKTPSQWYSDSTRIITN